MEKSVVITDKAIIRKNIQLFDWREARRVKGPIYDALIQELNEENCLVSARHVQCLAKKEDVMMKLHTIRIAVRQKPALLEKIIYNIKTAEKAFNTRQCVGLTVTFQLLLQTLHLISEEGSIFDWLLKDVYKIIADICDAVPSSKQNDGTMRAFAHIYFNYGAYLCSKKIEMEIAHVSLGKALKLARGNNWPASGYDCEDWDQCETLHAATVKKLVTMLLDYALKLMRTDGNKAIALGKEAINTIAEVKSKEASVLFWQSQLLVAKISTHQNEFENALRFLDQISKEMSDEDKLEHAMLNCEVVLYRGKSYDGLGDPMRAQQTLRQALKLSKQHKLSMIQAKCCFGLGRLHLKQQHELMTAKRYFEKAKLIYTLLGKLKDVKFVIYQLAKLEAKRLFPLFMELVKSHDEHYCCFYHIRSWKNFCKPFWPEMNQQLFEKELLEAHCLLAAKSATCVNPIRSMPNLTALGGKKGVEKHLLKHAISQEHALETLRHSSLIEKYIYG